VGGRVDQLAHLILIMNLLPFPERKIRLLIKGIIKIDLHGSTLPAVLLRRIFQKLKMINLFQNYILGNRDADAGNAFCRQCLIRFFHVGKADFCPVVKIVVTVKIREGILKIALIGRRAVCHKDAAIGNADLFQRFLHKLFLIHIDTDDIRHAGITDSRFRQRF